MKIESMGLLTNSASILQPSAISTKFQMLYLMIFLQKFREIELAGFLTDQYS
jgi:hypothetical protein